MACIRCGNYERRYIYFGGTVSPGATPQQRRTKSREQKVVASERRNLSNFKMAKRKFRALLFGNVEPGWTLVTLTYDDEHVPKGRNGVKPSWKSFSSTVRYWAKARGLQFTYFRVIEDRHGDGRPHIHLVCNIPVAMREEFLTLWNFGAYEQQDMQPVQTTPGGVVDVEALVQYLNKEHREIDERLYTTSRNIRKIEKLPAEEVPNDTGIDDIELPDHHYILERKESSGLYSYIGYIDYVVLPD